MPEKSPEFWIQVWNVLPEPVKAVILSVALAIAMAFKEDGRTLKEKIVDTVSIAVMVLIGGSAIEMLGLSGGWTYVLSGALAGYGIGPVKKIGEKVAHGIIDKWLSK